ncbi:MAG: hypothetical protein AAF533_08430 [Acidobacteriota bacterium]
MSSTLLNRFTLLGVFLLPGTWAWEVLGDRVEDGFARRRQAQLARNRGPLLTQVDPRFRAELAPPRDAPARPGTWRRVDPLPTWTDVSVMATDLDLTLSGESAPGRVRIDAVKHWELAVPSGTRWLEADLLVGDARTRFEALRVDVNGREVPRSAWAWRKHGGRRVLHLQAAHDLSAGRVPVELCYRVRGASGWGHRLEQREPSSFRATVRTDFTPRVPSGSVEPLDLWQEDDGWLARWEGGASSSGSLIAIERPTTGHSERWAAARLISRAPVVLLLSGSVLGLLALAQGRPLPPHQWLLTAAGVVSFYLLLPQLVLQLGMALAFSLSAAVSVVTTCLYLQGVVSPSFAWLQAGPVLLVFHVGFSLGQLFPRVSGVVTAGCAVLALGLVMQLVARLERRRDDALDVGGQAPKGRSR